MPVCANAQVLCVSGEGLLQPAGGVTARWGLHNWAGMGARFWGATPRALLCSSRHGAACQANWALVLYTMASSVWFVCFDVACASRDGAADSVRRRDAVLALLVVVVVVVAGKASVSLVCRRPQRNAPSTAASFTPYFEVAGFPFIGGPAVCCTVAGMPRVVLCGRCMWRVVTPCSQLRCCFPRPRSR